MRHIALLLTVLHILAFPAFSYALESTPLYKGTKLTLPNGKTIILKEDSILIPIGAWNVFEKKYRLLDSTVQLQDAEIKLLREKMLSYETKITSLENIIRLSNEMVKTCGTHADLCYKELTKEKSSIMKSPVFWYAMGALSMLAITVGVFVAKRYIAP